jgi:amidase
LNELLACPAHDLAARIRAGEVSATEVVEVHLRRIDAVNGTLHAVVALSPTALADAQSADARRARGDALGPLHGVPFTVKDWIETAGLPCPAGREARRERVPREDATAVARLRAAGAILLGKTKPGSTPDTHPAPRNPYDTTRAPGASSSGEAAIIAAGGSPCGLGSDSGGSIRWPAHCCGIAGMKPSNGLVPLTGHFPRIIATTDPRTVIGPMARDVDDLALVTSLIAGVDWRDASVVPMPLCDHRAVDLDALRVVRLLDIADAVPTAATTAAIDEAARALANAGAEVRYGAPPRLDESLAITRAYWARPESISLESWRPPRPSTLSADEVERSLFEWDRLRRAFVQFMENVDLIVSPVATDVAPARETAQPEDYVYTLPWSLVGYPAVVVRAGTSPEGLPIGVQLIARPWHDHVALAAARHLQRALGGWTPPPLG